MEQTTNIHHHINFVNNQMLEAENRMLEMNPYAIKDLADYRKFVDMLLILKQMSKLNIYISITLMTIIIILLILLLVKKRKGLDG
ncbi:hypothetical protein ACPTG4_00475 [Enterococcus faecalis]|uniref:hypothetical protein n=1 Tax=Enterococcus faecalis TaxID=1351 RepID=UPI003CC5FB9D